MRRMRGTIALLAGLASLAAPAPVLAQGSLSAVQEAALQRLRAEADFPLHVLRHAGTARIRTLKGRLSPPGDGTAAATAGGFLRDEAALLGLKPDAGDLELAVQRESPGGTHLGYRQMVGELPVFNGGLEVTLDREKRVFLVNSDYVPADAPNLPPALSAAAAAAAGRADLPGGTPSREPQLGVFLVGDTPRLSWRFVLEKKAPVAVVQYTVDAADGAILERRDLVQRYRDGWGRVFDPNPVNTLRNTALTDSADADGAAFAPAYRTVPLRSLVCKGRTGPSCFLSGPYVSVSDAKEKPFLFPATRGMISSETGGFRFVRKPDQFEHVMAYYHIDANQRYIQSLGLMSVNNRRVRVDPHGLADADSSHYVAKPVGAGYLAFGSGGVDDAEDADVILHEYAHAIQDNQAPGKYLGASGEAAAMGEGFADYWAASSTYERSVANGFDPACIGEWNAAPGCMDRVDGTKRYADRVGDAQADGRIWSAALWDLFKATGDRWATDSIALESHFLVPANPTFADGADAIIAADEALYAGLHKTEICSVMVARGIFADGCGLWATVTWDNADVDLDLRLRPPDGADVTGWDYDGDCFSGNQRPDWGVAQDPADDPLLLRDCRYSCTEEQIVLGAFGAPGPYQVLVHYYLHTGWLEKTTTATVTVHRGRTQLFSGSRLLRNPDNYPETGDLWTVTTVEVAP